MLRRTLPLVVSLCFGVTLVACDGKDEKKADDKKVDDKKVDDKKAADETEAKTDEKKADDGGW